MSNLRRLVGQVRLEALSPRHLAVFTSARARQPALSPYLDMASVLAVLDTEDEHAYPQREALAQALVAEHRAGSGALWALALVAAFYPMLSRLRHRLVGGSVPGEDLDQIVLTAFLSALNEVPVHDPKARTALRLRQRTQRQVFRILRHELAGQRLAAAARSLSAQVAEWGLDLDDLDEPDEDEEVVMEAVLPALLVRLPQEVLPRRGRELLIATVVQRERLRDYVHRTVPGDAETRERAYERLKRQRSRDLQRLRAMIASSRFARAGGY